MFHIRLHHQYH